VVLERDEFFGGDVAVTAIGQVLDERCIDRDAFADDVGEASRRRRP